MSETPNETEEGWWRTPLLQHLAPPQQRENQVFLLLTLAIGALTGLAVVAFIMLTERLGMRLYPVGSHANLSGGVLQRSALCAVRSEWLRSASHESRF